MAALMLLYGLAPNPSGPDITYQSQVSPSPEGMRLDYFGQLQSHTILLSDKQQSALRVCSELTAVNIKYAKTLLHFNFSSPVYLHESFCFPWFCTHMQHCVHTLYCHHFLTLRPAFFCGTHFKRFWLQIGPSKGSSFKHLLPGFPGFFLKIQGSAKNPLKALKVLKSKAHSPKKHWLWTMVLGFVPSHQTRPFRSMGSI